MGPFGLMEWISVAFSLAMVASMWVYLKWGHLFVLRYQLPKMIKGAGEGDKILVMLGRAASPVATLLMEAVVSAPEAAIVLLYLKRQPGLEADEWALQVVDRGGFVFHVGTELSARDSRVFLVHPDHSLEMIDVTTYDRRKSIIATFSRHGRKDIVPELQLALRADPSTMNYRELTSILR